MHVGGSFGEQESEEDQYEEDDGKARDEPGIAFFDIVDLLTGLLCYHLKRINITKSSIELRTIHRFWLDQRKDDKLLAEWSFG